MLRVTDDRDPVVQRLDAARPRTGADAPDDVRAAEIEDDDVALEIRGHERDRRAAEPGGEREGLGRKREHARSGREQEPSPVHSRFYVPPGSRGPCGAIGALL